MKKLGLKNSLIKSTILLASFAFIFGLAPETNLLVNAEDGNTGEPIVEETVVATIYDQNTGKETDYTDAKTAFFDLKPGETIILHQDVTIPSGELWGLGNSMSGNNLFIDLNGYTFTNEGELIEGGEDTFLTVYSKTSTGKFNNSGNLVLNLSSMTADEFNFTDGIVNRFWCSGGTVNISGGSFTIINFANDGSADVNATITGDTRIYNINYNVNPTLGHKVSTKLRGGYYCENPIAKKNEDETHSITLDETKVEEFSSQSDWKANKEVLKWRIIGDTVYVKTDGSQMKYAAIQDAFEAAPNGSKIIINNNTTISKDETLVLNENIKNGVVFLDLNGKTFTNEGSIKGSMELVISSESQTGTFINSGVLDIPITGTSNDTYSVTDGTINKEFVVKGGNYNISGGDFTGGIKVGPQYENAVDFTISENALIRDMSINPDTSDTHHDISVKFNGGYYKNDPNSFIGGVEQYGYDNSEFVSIQYVEEYKDQEDWATKLTGIYKYRIKEFISIETANITEIADQTFTGEPITPDFEVTVNGKKLTEGIDYKVNYTNNVKVGMANAEIIGERIYIGSANASFNIRGRSAVLKKPENVKVKFKELKKGTIKVACGAEPWEIEGDIAVLSVSFKKQDGVKRYFVCPCKQDGEYENNAASGNVPEIIIVDDTKAYWDNYEATFAGLNGEKITQTEDTISVDMMVVSPSNTLDYPAFNSGDNIRIYVKAFSDDELNSSDFTLINVPFESNGVGKEYDENGEIKTAEKEEPTEAEKEKPTEAEKPNTSEESDGLKSIADAVVTISPQTYTGKALNPPFDVKLDGVVLKRGADFDVKYKNNVNAGQGTVIITGKNGYKGSKTFTFKINPCKEKLTVTLSSDSIPYNGKIRKPTITVKCGKVKLKEKKDYTVSIKGTPQKIGSYTVTIKCQKNYSGTYHAKFKIVKGNNPITVKAKTQNLKAGEIKIKTKTITADKVFIVKNAEGKVTYKKQSGNANIKVASNGKITVNKGLKKGTYSIKVKVTAAGNTNYKSVTKVVAIKITVK